MCAPQQIAGAAPQVRRATQSSSAGQRLAHSRRHDLVERVVAAVGRRVDLVQRLDDEPRTAQQADPVAVRRVELDPAPGPLHPVGLVVAAEQPLLRRRPRRPGTHSADRWLLVRKTRRPPGRSSRAASGSQRSGSHQAAAPCSLTTRSNRPSRERDSLDVAPAPAGRPARRRRCSRRAVASCSPERSTATGFAPGPRQPRRDVRRAAGQLEHVEPPDVAEHPEVALGHAEQAPHARPTGPTWRRPPRR